MVHVTWKDILHPPPRKEDSNRVFRIVASILELLGLVGFLAIAAFFRITDAYFIWPDLNDLCATSTYKHAPREAPFNMGMPFITIIAIVGPCVYVLTAELFSVLYNNHSNRNESLSWYFWRRLSKVMVIFLLGLFITSAMADLLKLMISRPRPYFLHEYGYYCNKTAEKSIGEQERTARLSFPSYRCAILAYSGVLASIQTEIVLREIPGLQIFRAVLTVLATLPVIFATSDVYTSNLNHWEDIVGGLLLGAAVAAYMGLLFPAVDSVKEEMKGENKIQHPENTVPIQNSTEGIKVILPRPVVTQLAVRGPSSTSSNSRRDSDEKE